MRALTGTERVIATQNALSTTAEKIASISAGRHRIVVKNIDPSITVYLGGDSSVTSSTGFQVLAGESFPVYSKGEVYAIAASGTPTVCIWDED